WVINGNTTPKWPPSRSCALANGATRRTPIEAITRFLIRTRPTLIPAFDLICMWIPHRSSQRSKRGGGRCSRARLRMAKTSAAPCLARRGRVGGGDGEAPDAFYRGAGAVGAAEMTVDAGGIGLISFEEYARRKERPGSVADLIDG